MSNTLPVPGFVPRRRMLAALPALAAMALLPIVRSGAQVPSLTPTPGQVEGPFYPKTFPADRDSDLTQIVGRSARALGTPLYLSGRVQSRDGRPLANVTVELWQCDVYGRYHHAGDDGQPRDENFQGYGVATTDTEGRYAFKTIRPVAYGGRPPHLHVKLRAPGTGALTTQLYVAGDSVEGDVVLGSSPKGTLARLAIALTPDPKHEGGALAATFDFVLR